MEAIPFFIIGLYMLAGIAIIILLIYFLSKRLKERKEETFEKRDN